MEVNSKGLGTWFLILLVICSCTALIDSQLNENVGYLKGNTYSLFLFTLGRRIKMEITSKGLDSWFLILLVICVSTPLVDSQLDANGFINIDCGRAPNSSFYDSDINSTYVSDDQFIDTGENHRINSKYATQGLHQELLTVRSFPSGTRNCYTLRSLTIGSKYLIRAEFMYANYDNLNNPPTFELHLGINYWNTVETTADTDIFTEIVATATSDSLQVCLINKKLGTPFVSVLHLSQLKSSMYKPVNSTRSMVYSDRANLRRNLRSGERNKHKSLVVTIVLVVGAVVLLLIAAIITLCVCLRKSKNTENFSNDVYGNIQVEGWFDFKIGRYSYNDLVRITNNFQNRIGGVGGFGRVYVGFLADGTQVAVKRLSHSSSQGVEEFSAQVQNLARVRHKNLVSLIGYCMDRDCRALVYEYMQEGTLQSKLMDNARPLSWKQRVQIAYQSALGLEYLHMACYPPLIHGDVKTRNILLNENLVAKIYNYGLSLEFNSTSSSHVSTAVFGTPGYLDPEYYSSYQLSEESGSYQLSEKSDVFSFGVVLLEIITGKPPIIPGPDGGQHLKQWVNEKLSIGDIESIVEPKMQWQFDINSVLKVTELARKCTEDSSARRPTMRMVIAELDESLDLEISTEENSWK